MAIVPQQLPPITVRPSDILNQSIEGTTQDEVRLVAAGGEKVIFLVFAKIEVDGG